MQLNITKEWFMKRGALEGDSEIGVGFRPCNCIGPQNGQPVCPCAMRSVTIENGRYVDRPGSQDQELSETAPATMVRKSSRPW